MKLQRIGDALSRRPPAAQDPNGGLQAGVSLLLIPGPHLLLIRRAEHPDDPWSGQIGLPGGTKEAYDADLLVTAIRETQEEVGVSLPAGSLLGRLDDFRPRGKALPDILIRPFVFGLEKKPEATNSEEVQYCFWTPLKTLAGSRGEREVEASGAPRTVETYLAGEGEIVWGITYRILSELIRKLDLFQ